MTPVQFSCNDAHKDIFRKQPTKKKKNLQVILFIHFRMQEMANVRMCIWLLVGRWEVIREWSQANKILYGDWS